MRRVAALAALSLAAFPALGQTDTTTAPSAGSLVQATLGLALVLVLILAIAWIAKRVAPGALRGAGVPLTIVASQAVGQRERVVVVEVADQWLVLGVAPGRVSALSTLPKGELATPSATSAPFAAALSRALGRRDG
jgi:flagellar protein FliO/FliZ